MRIIRKFKKMTAAGDRGQRVDKFRMAACIDFHKSMFLRNIV